MRIFLLTGEPSGDMHGAHLARALLAAEPQLQLFGIGGPAMAQAGVKLQARSEHWGAIGIPDAMRKIPGLLVRCNLLARQLRAEPPDVLVLIDFGAFNMHLLRKLRGSGIRSVYYIPPGCWSRSRAAGELPSLVQAVATPFSWSADNLRRAGAAARIEWVGHPIAEYTRQAATRSAARAVLQLSDSQTVLALVPGSRKSEVRYLLKNFLDAAKLLQPAPVCLLSVASSIGKTAIMRTAPVDLDIRYLDGLDYQLLPAADAALVASGTATLELACLDVPMVVAYRGSLASQLLYLYLSRTGRIPEFISLPNIVAEAKVVPELLQDYASPQGLLEAVRPLMVDSTGRNAQLHAFAAIRQSLGDGNSSELTAEMILEVARN